MSEIWNVNYKNLSNSVQKLFINEYIKVRKLKYYWYKSLSNDPKVFTETRYK